MRISFPTHKSLTRHRLHPARLTGRLPRNLLPKVIFAAVYLGAMALVVAPRGVLGVVPAAEAAPTIAPLLGMPQTPG